MRNSIAVLGGTFNPVHNGHIAIAEAALKEFGFSKIVFLPNGNPPHKTKERIIDSSHRCNMIRLAIKDRSEFELSDYEINTKEPSYTVDTQRELKKIYNCPIYFIIGADSLYTLHRWKSPEILIKECSFIVADRTSDTSNNINEYISKMNSLGANIRALSMPRIDITSTMVRQALTLGKDVSGLVPKKVYEYIRQQKLYLQT